ncbi:transglutaminase domain-containing protein [Haloferula sargassicola]|uniref:Transglutaminase-like domain-containing protein n=1 Tax=Haloferula sargassicola TaxID=490096 RepID=A0ABP9UHI1_9BACT
MKALLALVAIATAAAQPVDEFIDHAREAHGAFGEKAARFLVENMPRQDRESLSAAFLNENLDLAIQARETFPWAQAVPEPIFLNDVLPYAVFDEPRDPWRADFLEKCTPIVKGAGSATEAAQRLNRDLFKLLETHYNTDRERTNQSPKESIEQGKATCTGLSIILVDACRAVGIPARAVGTPMWSNGRGNHTWVEIWDGGWHFTGADEFDQAGLDRGWFTGDAAKARADVPEHAIYATSWKRDGLHFPMIWSPKSESVAAVNVTERYAQSEADRPVLGVRLSKGGEGDTRVAAKGALTSVAGRILEPFETKAGSADLNDMPRLAVTPGNAYRLRFEIGGAILETEPFTAGDGETTRDVIVSKLKAVPEAVQALTENPDSDPTFTAEESDRVVRLIAEQLLEPTKAERAAELENKAITLGDKTLLWKERTFGEAERGQRSLWISMHGGGGTTKEVNDQQWSNQVNLYDIPEGICVAPRAPTDSWNMWHQEHIDPLFSRLIEDMVALRGVDPDKVYLTGYSAGGDGVWQVAPRMADRFAAAAMMAGHPNEASLLGLRNLPFAIFMGGEDSAYDRNKIAAERLKKLDELHAADPQGYTHMGRIYEGLGHWMNRKDAEGIPWMAGFTRDPWPKKIVWFQDDVTHRRFYWLQLPEGYETKAGQEIVATVEGRTITLTGDVPAGTRILLHDRLIDLDQPLELIAGGASSTVKPVRSVAVIHRALAERWDPASCPTAELRVK